MTWALRWRALILMITMMMILMTRVSVWMWSTTTILRFILKVMTTR